MSNNGNQVKKEPNGLFKAIGTQKLVAVIALIVLFMFFWIFGDNFAKYSTLVSIFDSSYYIGFMAIGVTFVIITGGIDLSIGTVCICCSLISGTLYTKLGLPMPLCVILAILMGGLFGLANGLMVSVMRLPAFIATLGTMMITRGLGSIVTNTATVTFPQASAPGGSFRGIFKLKGAGLPQAGIPTGFILLIVCLLYTSVLHAHPPVATGYAVANVPLDEYSMIETVIALGSIPVTPYGTPSTYEVPDNIAPYLGEHDAMLLQNHGALTVGADVITAYYRMETLELFAKISLNARMLGGAQEISRENIDRLISMRKGYGVTGRHPGYKKYSKQGENRC